MFKLTLIEMDKITECYSQNGLICWYLRHRIRCYAGTFNTYTKENNVGKLEVQNTDAKKIVLMPYVACNPVWESIIYEYIHYYIFSFV